MANKITPEWKPRALIVEDDMAWKEIYRDKLKKTGWRTDVTDDVSEAIRSIRDGNKYKAVIVDMGGRDLDCKPEALRRLDCRICIRIIRRYCERALRYGH